MKGPTTVDEVTACWDKRWIEKENGTKLWICPTICFCPTKVSLQKGNHIEQRNLGVLPLLTQTVVEPYIKNPSCKERAEKAKQADAERKDPDEPDKEVISHSSEMLMIRSIRKLFKYLRGNNSFRITPLLMKRRNQVFIDCGSISCVILFLQQWVIIGRFVNVYL